MIKVYNCKRCGHEWAARKPDKPTICPKCKSAYWDKSRKR
jgi:predicted Zn-ribbon and HTH transcriptional regulator